MSVHAGKYETEDKSRTDTIQKLKIRQPRKRKQHKTQQNKTSLVYLWHSAMKRGGLTLQRSWAHTGPCTDKH